METYLRVLNTNFNFDNIKVFNVINNRTNELLSYELKPAKGYVIYDLNANDIEIDQDTMTEVPITYYRTYIGLPKTYNFNNFHWAAIDESIVDKKYIFGN